MTVQGCIEYVDSIEPNAYTDTQKAGWLSECEGKVYTSLFLVQPYEFTPVTASDSRTLALPAPYDRMYPRYLQAMIHYANGEYDRYANSMAAFNEVWAEANRWFGGDYDVTDRLRNRRFEGTVTQELGDQVILEIPEGCAVAAGRILVETPYTETNIYTARETLSAGTYCMQDANGTWKHFTLPEISVGGTVYISGNTATYRTTSTAQPAVTGATAGKSGTELVIRVTAEVWVGDKTNVIAQVYLDVRGSVPLPMILSDRDGMEVGITVRELAIDSTGAAKLTGHLLIPDERWSYETQYAGRRDARWRG